MSSIVHVGDGDGPYGKQWNLSGDCRVSIVLRDLSPRPQAVLFNRLIPSVFHKTQNIHPKTPLKCNVSIWAGPNTFPFWSANFQIKLAPLILYTTLVYTSTLKNLHFENIFQIFVILIKKLLLLVIKGRNQFAPMSIFKMI